MADAKISALTNLTAADPTNDMIPIVDVSDTPPASGNTKRISINNILSSSPTASGAFSVTGLVTAGSASITGALTVDTSTLVVDATNDRVGVNTATFDTNWGPKLQTSSASTDGSGGIVIESYKPNLILKDSSVGAQRRHIYADGGVQYFGYGDASIAEHLSIGTTGNVSVALGNVVMGTSGKGIDFSAVTGGTGTATANVLNDYEEGTFTPTVIGATTAGVGVYGTQVGRYTKIGNLVTVQVYLGWSAHTGTGNMRFGNFPFTTSSDSGSNNGVSFGYVNNIALSASNVLTSLTSPGNSYVDAYQYPVGGGASTAVPIDTAGDVIFTASYRV